MIEENIKISVIIPCYNQAEYLPETLQSVLNQSYQNWECIMVNDGSPDNTDAIAKHWTEQDKRFIYIEKENGGLSSARNAGIEKAQGEWILPLDSDDIIAPDYMKYAAEEIKNNPDWGIIYARYAMFGTVTGEMPLIPYSLEKLLHENLIYCSAFYRKQDWERVGGYDTNLKQGWEDWEFWINLLGTTHKEVKLLDYLGFHYRIKQESMITNLVGNKEKELAINTYVMKKHLDLYINTLGTYPDLLTRIEVLESDLAYANKSMIVKLMGKIRKQLGRVKRRLLG